MAVCNILYFYCRFHKYKVHCDRDHNNHCHKSMRMPRIPKKCTLPYICIQYPYLAFLCGRFHMIHIDKIHQKMED